MANDDLLFADMRVPLPRATSGVGSPEIHAAPVTRSLESDDERKIAVICRLKETGELLFITTYALA